MVGRRLVSFTLPAPLWVATAGLGCDAEPVDSADPDPCARRGELTWACEELSYPAAVERELGVGVALPDVPRALAVGDLAGIGTPQVYVGTNTTLTRLDGDGWATTTDVWTHASGQVIPLLADLTADGVVDLALGLPDSDEGLGQVIVFPGPVVEPVDWSSPHWELQGQGSAGSALFTADFDADGTLDLAGNGWIHFGPVVADGVLGGDADARLPRAIEAVGDLTGDGVVDLLLSGERADRACDDWTHGELWVVPGPLLSGTEVDATAVLRLPAPRTFELLSWWPYLGLVVVDVDGDGQLDVLASGFEMGRPLRAPARLVAWLGPVRDGVRPEVELPAPGWMSLVSDLDGDGAADLLHDGSTGARWAEVRLGPVAALPDVDAASCALGADEAWLGPEEHENLLATTADLDGDDLPDVVLAAEAPGHEGSLLVQLGRDR